MANIYDFIKWRGDLTFAADEFHVIDALVFALLSYVELDGMLSGSGECITIHDAAVRYFELHERDEKKDNREFLTRVPYLLEAAGNCERYGSIEMSDYEDVVDPERSLQMAAVTFHLPDGADFVSFRGTDNTIAGWKEDLEISLGSTEGQKMCAQYLDRVCAGTNREIRIGGHSKGGNFAQYAAGFCSREVQNRIRKVYSLDGPGLHESLKQTDDFARVEERIFKVVPEQSMIGMIFSDGDEDLVVKSTAFGIMQHDAFTWQIEGKEFICTGKVADSSLYFRNLIRNWLAQVDEEKREMFIDLLFSFLEATGASTFKEVYGSAGASLAKMLPLLKNVDDSRKKEFEQVLRALAESAVTSRAAE